MMAIDNRCDNNEVRVEELTAPGAPHWHWHWSAVGVVKWVARTADEKAVIAKNQQQYHKAVNSGSSSVMMVILLGQRRAAAAAAAVDGRSAGRLRARSS